MAIQGKVGFVGCGNMGGALLRGMLAKGLVSAGQVTLAEANLELGRALAAELGVEAVASAGDLRELDLLVLAVKPPYIAQVAAEARHCLTPGSLVISVAAGVPTSAIAEALGPGQALVRAMPNTPALIGRGSTAICAAPGTPAQAVDTALQVFSAVGTAVQVAEPLMDAVVGVSGSGPAYVYLFIEAMADAGVDQGLDRPTALKLAAGTVAGAAQLVLQDGRHPAQLKDMVTSPGGTTIAALQIMERAGLRGIIMDAVEEAARRSRELGGGK